MKIKWLLLLLLLALSLVSCGDEKNTEQKDIDDSENYSEEYVEEYVNDQSATAARISDFFEERSQKGIFNGAVLFAEKGQIIYKKAFGYANLKTNERLRSSHIFQLASVSKQFTAFAIMLLKERKKLSYEDNVKKFFPKFPYEGITIRELLTHSSGLPNYMYFADEYWPNKLIPITNSDVIKMMETYRPEAYFSPGRRYNYSNTGYCILASIVEKVSKMPFAKFMSREVFRPLGMRQTFVHSAGRSFGKRKIALGYYGNRREVEFNYQDGVVGDKGVYSTVDDLLKWDQSLYEGKLVSLSTLNEAFTPQYHKVNVTKNYGFGWRINEDEEGEKFVYHGGWWKGYRSYIVRMMNERRTAIILINVASHVDFRIDDLIELFKGNAGA